MMSGSGTGGMPSGRGWCNVMRLDPFWVIVTGTGSTEFVLLAACLLLRVGCIYSFLVSFLVGWLAGWMVYIYLFTCGFGTMGGTGEGEGEGRGGASCNEYLGGCLIWL